jgi:hypothetical protein
MVLGVKFVSRPGFDLKGIFTGSCMESSM